MIDHHGPRVEPATPGDPAAVQAAVDELSTALAYAATVLVIARDPHDPTAVSIAGITFDPSVCVAMQGRALARIAAQMTAHHDEHGCGAP